MTQGERVRNVRKELGLTLEKFGKRIGLKKSGLSQIENGINDLTEANIKSICREYKVSEEWLRYESGDMFVSKIKNEKLLGFIDDVMGDADDSFRKNFIASIADFEPEDWIAVEDFIKKILKKD